VKGDKQKSQLALGSVERLVKECDFKQISNFEIFVIVADNVLSGSLTYLDQL